MSGYIPPSIKTQGLRQFLNDSATKHRGLGYREFKILQEADLNLTNFARAFNVSRPTIIKWLEVDQEETAGALAK